MKHSSGSGDISAFQTRKCSWKELNNKWSYLWQCEVVLACKELNKVLVMIHVYVATFVRNGRTNGRTKTWSQYLYVSSTITPWTAIMLRSRSYRFLDIEKALVTSVIKWSAGSCVACFYRMIHNLYPGQEESKHAAARNAKQAPDLRLPMPSSICCLQMLLRAVPFVCPAAHTRKKYATLRHYVTTDSDETDIILHRQTLSHIFYYPR